MRSRIDAESSTPTGPAPTIAKESSSRHRVGRQLAGRDLVEQRCEEREVGAVDQRDLRLAGPQALLQVTDEVQTAEPAAHDDDALRHSSGRNRSRNNPATFATVLSPAIS